MTKMGDFLREELEAYALPDDRTVINFLFAPENKPAGYEYVAIFIADRGSWYLSGRIRVDTPGGMGAYQTSMSHDEMMTFLARADVVGARTAVTWDVFKAGRPVEGESLCDHTGRPLDEGESLCDHTGRPLDEGESDEDDETTDGTPFGDFSELLRALGFTS